jgi:hypothetical protein
MRRERWSHDEAQRQCAVLESTRELVGPEKARRKVRQPWLTEQSLSVVIENGRLSPSSTAIISYPVLLLAPALLY